MPDQQAKYRAAIVGLTGIGASAPGRAPDAVLSSMVKRVDLVVYQTIRDLAEGRFQAGNSALGVRENAVGYAEVRVDFPGKQQALQRVEALRKKIVSGEIKVPSKPAQLSSFKASP